MNKDWWCPGCSGHLLALLLCLSLAAVRGHESCCAKAAAALQGSEEWIPNPDAQQPADWDEEEDGPWQRPLIRKPKPSSWSIFATELQNSLLDACPWLLLGLLCNSAVQALSPSDDFVRQQLSGPSITVLGKGAALGLLSPLCNCGALPLASGMASLGVAPSAIVAFLVAAQSAGVDSLLFTWGVLGWRAALLRLLAAAIIAVVVGAAVPKSSIRSHVAPSACDKKTDCAGSNDHLSNGHDASKTSIAFPKWLDSLLETFQEIAPPVFVGFIATAIVGAVLPPQGLAAAAALGGLAGRAAVLGLALPMQFCEHAAVPLASALYKAGASGGLAFALLATLPAINLSSLTIVAALTGAAGAIRVCLALWAVGIVGSLVADSLNINVVMVGESSDALPHWYVHSSPYVVAALLVAVAVRLVTRRLARATGNAGQSCCNSERISGHCKGD